MPMVDIELVCGSEPEFGKVSARELADALGQVFGSTPGRTWVRLHHLSSAAYAENNVAITRSELPAFVTILHARPPEGAALATELDAVTIAVAKCLAREPGRIHVQYAPAGRGRQAFGGRLVD